MGNNEIVINQYQYSDALMEEVQDGYAKRSYSILVILAIITAVCAFFTYREFTTDKLPLAVLFAIVGIGAFAAIIATLISSQKNCARAKEEFRKTYGKGFEYRIELDSKKIKTYIDGKEAGTYARRDILESLETERCFVFLIRGQVILPLKKEKSAFLKGSLKDCKNYCPQSPKK